MENFADITDEWGAWIRVDVIPGPLVTLTIRDETMAAVALNRKQAVALINALTDAVGGNE